jgi:predicted dehydrogenase
MKILKNNQWEDGFLDYHRSPTQYRIKVKAWHKLEKVDDMYFVRPKSPALVLSYAKEIGMRATARKIHSRLNEALRNEKYKASGIGVVIESADESKFSTGTTVHFSVPATPHAQRIVVNENQITKFNGGNTETPRTETIQEIKEAATKKTRKKSAVLFGYGNYAKVNIIPHIKKYLSLQGIHEIDPTQIPRNPSKKITWDTSPHFREGERYDAAFIAGYHHTHAKLAIRALERNMDVVIEKPIATEEEDFINLIKTAERSHGKIFASFHKRYLPFNKYIHEDLGIEKRKPFSYHCIVYEVALPKLHWYRWPVSKSRLFADGCHWIDHFLFLNKYSKPKRTWVTRGPNVVNCSILLENGSYFTMILTTVGSPRTGVQDYIELRRDNVTIRMKNGSHYEAENGTRRVRKARVNKMKCYENMYRNIAKRISEGSDGDSPESIEVSIETMLQLEKQYEANNPKL